MVLVDEVWAEPDWDEGVRHCLEMVEPHLIYGGAILDYGCGVGRLMKPLAHKHTRTRFVGVDNDPRMLDYASQDARRNEEYSSEIGEGYRSAFSVITFQHIPDPEVRDVLEKLCPVPFRFQFAIGDNQSYYNYQRSPEEVANWCWAAGYEEVHVEDDPKYPTWRWVTV